MGTNNNDQDQGQVVAGDACCSRVHYLLQFFSYDHLPHALKQISRPFHDLAVNLDADLMYGLEKTEALRKLLEAKDCAVRSFIQK